MPTKRGLYWHVHHDVLYEHCWDAERRMKYIRENKPEGEVALRLKLIKPVRGKLGDQKLLDACDKAGAAYSEAWDACVKAGAAYDKARAAYDKAWDAYDKARAAYDKARAAYDKARAAYDKAWDACVKAGAAYSEAWTAYEKSIKPDEAEALHAKECSDCPWNGETIFP